MSDKFCNSAEISRVLQHKFRVGLRCARLDNMRPVQLFYSAVTSGSIQFPPSLWDSSLTSAGLEQLQTGRQPGRWANSPWRGSGERHWPGWPQRRSTVTHGTNTLLLPTEVPFGVWTQVPLGTKRGEQETMKKSERQNERNNVLGIISYFGLWTPRWYIFKPNWEHLV